MMFTRYSREIKSIIIGSTALAGSFFLGKQSNLRLFTAKMSYAKENKSNLSSYSLFSNQETTLIELLRNYNNRPHAGLAALASANAYEAEKVVGLMKNELDNEVKVTASEINQAWPAGWELDSYRKHDDSSNTYFALVLRNEEKRQMVLSYRGSATAQDWQADLKLVRKQLDEHFVWAIEHGLEVHSRAQREGYQLTLTGHSLGGALAITSLYMIKRSQATKKDDLSLAITFDNPGMFEYLEALQPTIKGHEVKLSDLNLTCYLSGAANPINTCGSHIGTVYALIATQGQDRVEPTISYVAQSHVMRRLIHAFDLQTGKINTQLGWQAILMKSWPRIKFAEDLNWQKGFATLKPEIGIAAKTVKDKFLSYFKSAKNQEEKANIHTFNKTVDEKLIANNDVGWSFARAIGGCIDWGKVGIGFLKLGNEHLEDTTYVKFREYANPATGWTISGLEKVYDDKQPLDERPKIVDEKNRIGDWEIDTIIGKQQRQAVISIVERFSKKTILKKVSKRTANSVAVATIESLKNFSDAVLSITADNVLTHKSIIIFR